VVCVGAGEGAGAGDGAGCLEQAEASTTASDADVREPRLGRIRR